MKLCIRFSLCLCGILRLGFGFGICFFANPNDSNPFFRAFNLFYSFFLERVCLRWWIIMCVHTQALKRVSQAFWQWLHVVAVVGSVICEFSVSNRGYDFPMREHHTFCCCSTFGGRWLPPNFHSLLLVALHDRLFVCLLACSLNTLTCSFVSIYLISFRFDCVSKWTTQWVCVCVYKSAWLSVHAFDSL